MVSTDSDTAEIILEHLRAMRRDQSESRQDVHDIKVRLTAIETRMESIEKNSTAIFAILREQGAQLTTHSSRLATIERALDIRSATSTQPKN